MKFKLTIVDQGLVVILKVSTMSCFGTNCHIFNLNFVLRVVSATLKHVFEGFELLSLWHSACELISLVLCRQEKSEINLSLNLPPARSN